MSIRFMNLWKWSTDWRGFVLFNAYKSTILGVNLAGIVLANCGLEIKW